MQTDLIDISLITFDDSTRQRKTLSGIESLADNINRRGLLHPVVVDRNFKLLAGRRRLAAHIHLGRQQIEVRYFENLDPAEQRLVELDENLQRMDITWQERALALLELHELLGEESVEATASRAGYSTQFVSRCIITARSLRAGDAKILACTSLNQAAELLNRKRNLAIETLFSKGEDLTIDGFDPVGNGGGGTPAAVDSVLQHTTNPGTTATPDGHNRDTESTGPRQRHSIICTDFIEFARSYAGPKFNFIHCDFPYGIGLDKSDAAGAEGHETQYEDSEDTFWGLTETLLQNQERLVLSSSHMVFWYSMKYHNRLLLRLRAAGWFVHDYPLIWYKSDGMGIASDYRRRPKHIYETALWCSRGDRQLLQLRNDVFAAPLAKREEAHVSAKPQIMLEYFLSMGVGDLTDFLDPTCGSGTSIRAAAALGANRSLGLELNAETGAAAQIKLEKFLKERSKADE